MTTTTAEFFVRVNAGQANEELNKTRTATLNLGGGLEKLDRATSVAGKGLSALGGVAGATARSSAEWARGLGDVVGLLGGGLLTGLITGAALAAVKLNDEFERGPRQIKTWAAALKSASDTEIAAIKRSIVDLQTELDLFGKNATEKRGILASMGFSSAVGNEKEAQRALLDLQQRREAIAAGMPATQLSATDAQAFRQKKEELQQIDFLILREKQRVESSREKVALYSQEIDQVRQLVALEKNAAAEAIKKRAAEKSEADKLAAEKTGGAAAKKASEDAKKTAEQVEIDAWNSKVAIEKAEREKQIARVKQEQEEILAMYGARDDARKDRETEHTRFLAEQERERTAAAKQALAERTRAEAEAQREKEAIIRSTTDTVLGITVGAAQIATAAAVDGQKNALEQIGVYLMAQAGTALIGGGIKLAGEAVVSALTPGLQPLAAAQGAGSLALIGSGVALGGASQYLGKLSAIGISAPKERGGDLGRAPGVGTGSRGFGNASSGGAAAGGRTVTVINVYGVSGPQAEDRARMTWRDLQLADRRGMGR